MGKLAVAGIRKTLDGVALAKSQEILTAKVAKQGR
jgi:hypothetical protein